MLLALVSAAFASEAGAVAGRTEFTIGGVTVARNGVERPLTRGTELDNGDVVRTNDGRAQIRFTDGAYVSLQPNTDFAIRDYRFENKTDGSERGFFGLVKGAMRTVTGLIGRVNRDRYQIVTPTATVGIRGTGGVIQVLQDGSTLVVGTSGIWSLTNPAGSIDVPAGVSGLSPTDPDDPPSQTTTQPTSGPTPLPPQEPVFVQGNEVDSSGGALIQTQFTPLVTGSGYAAALAYTLAIDGDLPFLDGGEGSFLSSDAVFDSGLMTAIKDPAFNGNIASATLAGGTHAEFATEGGVLAWGRWIGPVTVDDGSILNENYGPNQGFHYVVGLPTPVMPTNATATYTLLGATSPTFADGSVPPGTFSGKLTVEFFSGTTEVTGDFGVSIAGRAYSWSSFGSTSSSRFSLSTQSISGCSQCSAQARGFFAGTAASHAGVSYRIDDFGDTILGAAAFKRGELGPPPLLR
jgi:hypothetical protein